MKNRDSLAIILLEVLVNLHSFPRLLDLSCLPVKPGSKTLLNISICFAKLRGEGGQKRSEETVWEKKEQGSGGRNLGKG